MKENNDFADILREPILPSSSQVIDTKEVKNLKQMVIIAIVIISLGFCCFAFWGVIFGFRSISAIFNQINRIIHFILGMFN